MSNKMDYIFRQKVILSIYKVVEGIVTREAVEHMVASFTEANQKLPLILYKRQLARFLAKKFGGFFTYHKFDVDLNDLADELYEALTAIGRS